jgi:catechol 2,3-dioxygenase-like lactoylglutathione lyase family enzyme
MNLQIDHVVLWVADPLKSVAFFEAMLGVVGLRVEEFRAGKVPFPSVRLSPTSIVDLAPLKMAPVVNAIPGAAGSAGNKLFHLCLSMSKSDFDALRARLAAAGIQTHDALRDAFGAQGQAPETVYFPDPDGNILEARYYG